MNEVDEKIINKIVNLQEQQSHQMQVMNNTIQAMSENIVLNMRFELYDKMIECVSKGYATPKEYERITEKVHSYLALGGNHGILELYKDRFKTLPIKE